MIWSTLKSNRIESIKKTVKKEEDYAFKPKLYTNKKYKVESIKPEDRCLKWLENKKMNLDSYRNEIETQRKNIEDSYINHKLQLNSNYKLSNNKLNSDSTKNSQKSNQIDKEIVEITAEHEENTNSNLISHSNQIDNSKSDNFLVDSESAKLEGRNSNQSK